MATLLPIPRPDRLGDAAANAWDMVFKGGVADLRRTPARIIDEAPKRTVYRYIGGIFTEVLADPELGAEFKATEVIMGLHFTGPTSHLIIDAVEGKVYTGAECDSGPAPNIEMFMTADISHQFWLGKVNVTIALARGQIKAKGPVAKILKLVPLAKPVFPRYEAQLREQGRQDLIELD